MDAKIFVIITGAILVIAILVSLVMMRRNPNRFTYDTAHGTRPRASEGEGNTSQVAFKGRFTMLAAGVGAVFAAIFAKLWSMQMVSCEAVRLPMTLPAALKGVATREPRTRTGVVTTETAPRTEWIGPLSPSRI